MYVTLGGYSSHWNWARPRARWARGTSDAGETFTDLSDDLPDAPADAVIQVAARLVGTDIGVFASSDGGATWSVLGDLPALPVVHFALDPSNT